MTSSLASQPGCVGVVSGNRGTYWEFARCLQGVMACASTPVLLEWLPASGGTLALVRNEIVDRALSAGAEWIWFIDDDHVFAPDTLQRLLRHGRDIVVPLVTKRTPDRPPILYGPPSPIPETATDDELVQAAHDAVKTKADVKARGLLEMWTCAGSGMLVRARVFRTVPPPWFEFGKLASFSASEDTWFGCLARRAGFRIWCDTDTSIGHLMTAAAWPARAADGSLSTEIRMVQGRRPRPRPEVDSQRGSEEDDG